jgi:hypothetical protein
LKKKSQKVLIVLFLVLFCFNILFLYYYISSKELVVTSYSIKSTVTTNLRIVQLTDLHNNEFNDNNCQLVGLVEKQSPDLIVITGDMINSDDENLDIICTLISNLKKIAPVYYGYGNNEYNWTKKYSLDLDACLTDAGAIVVNNNYVDINING